MPRLGGSGRVRCVLPRTRVGALGIGENAGLHWLREVQGGQLGRGDDADGMPRLGDDVGPGCDLRFKVAQDVIAGEGARIADREQQAVPVSEIVFMGGTWRCSQALIRAAVSMSSRSATVRDAAVP